MSTIKVNSIKGVGASAAAITVNNTDGTCTANITNNLSNRRLTVNGAMTISQRSTSVASVSDGYHTVDRFKVNGTTGTFTMSQESDAPPGFSKSLKMLATADISAAAGNIREIYYSFEGQDLQLLEKGTSTAKKVTLSFYVKSNVTGLKTVYLLDKDNNRLNSQNYTINSSATWERKTITFDGDTTGALDNDNARSLDIHFPIVAGSNYTGGTQQTAWGADTVNERVSSSITQIDTTNEYWQITGVQLEVGSVATDFEHRSFGQELALCQRYFYVTDPTADNFCGGGGLFMFDGGETNVSYGSLTFAQTMRAAPTVVLRDNNGNKDGKVTQHGVAHNIPATATNINENGFSRINKTSGNWGTNAGNPIICGCTANAEL